MLIVLGLLASAKTARAQSAGGPFGDGRGVLEMEARGGAGWFLDTSAPGVVNTQRLGTERLGPGPLGEFRFGGRVTRWMSVGGHVTGQAFFGGQLPATLTAGGAGMVTSGFDVRVYVGSALRLPVIDPWVSAGFDPLAQVALGNQLATGVGSTGAIRALTLSIGGVAVPVTLGFDVNITRVFAVGVLARLSPFFPITRCVSDPSVMVSTTACSNAGLAPEASLSLAAGVRVTLPN